MAVQYFLLPTWVQWPLLHSGSLEHGLPVAPEGSAPPAPPLLLPLPPLPPTLDVVGSGVPPAPSDVVAVSCWFPFAQAAKIVETKPMTTNARPAQRRSVLMWMKPP